MAEYLVQDSTMTGIADAVRNLRHETGALTPAQIEAKIGSSRLGLPIDVTGHLVNNKWVRPSDYPNLDNISLNGFVGVYLTYDLRKTPGLAYISIYANVDNSSGSFSVQRGHLENNSFIVDETHTVTSLTRYNAPLDSQYGDVQLWRVIPNNNGTMLGFVFYTNVDSNSALSGGYQPVVERRGRLPDVNSFSTSLNLTTNSRGYNYNSTFWLEKDYMILPSSKAINMRYCYRDSISLQEFTILGDNNGNITLTGNSDGMFQDCLSLPYADLSNIKFGDSVNFSALFSGASSILSIDLSNSLVENTIYNFGSAFTQCNSCRKIKFGKKIKVSSCAYMFNYCTSLIDLDIENVGLDSNASSLYSIFNMCKSLIELDLSHWDYENQSFITDTRSMFSEMRGLKKLKISANFPVSSSAANVNGVPTYAVVLSDFNGMPIYQSHTYSVCMSFSHDSLVAMINALPTISSTKTMTIGTTNVNKLTSEEIAVGTNKGWTIA